jgi:parallel beta-helix repeat protein
MSKSVTAVLLLFLLTAPNLIMPLPANADPKTIVVPDDYPTITDAVGNAASGDTVFVKSGVYEDNLVINKPIFLIGENKETTIIICKDKKQPTILVKENRVNITGFTIKNNVTANSGSGTEQSALHLLHASFCNIYENLMINGGYGIWLYGANNNTIAHNLMSENNYGIMLESCSNNIILQNTISNCWTGICLEANGNVLKNNNMINNNFNLKIGSRYSDVGYYNDIDASNLIDGKKVFYLINQKNIEINSIQFPHVGFLALINCTNINVRSLNLTGNYEGLIVFGTSKLTISNNDAYGNSGGISIQNSFDITINGNNIYSNSGSGIFVQKSFNFTVLQNSFTNNWIGVQVWDSHNFSIVGNQIANMEYVGIEILGSENITIADNVIKDNEIGINHRQSAYPSYSDPTNEMISNNQIIGNKYSGISGNSNNSTITNNYVFGNGGSGIQVGTNCVVTGNNISQNKAVGMSFLSNNLVMGNYVSKNQIGIQAYYGNGNTVTANSIVENEGVGIRFQGHVENNTIYHNNFNNKVQFYSKDSTASNAWDNNNEGNYWSNYNGRDADGDGIGDTPYVIDEKNQDNYPLMKPVTITIPTATPTPTPTSSPTSQPTSTPTPTPTPTQNPTSTPQPGENPLTNWMLYLIPVALAAIIIALVFAWKRKKLNKPQTA